MDKVRVLGGDNLTLTIEALELIEKYTASNAHFFPKSEQVPLDGVIRPSWRHLVVEQDASGEERINRINYG